ncbi:hypothetical protein FFLO_05101 [Filobasidium floriforme]|uniref:BZIP domain-containing protein n=1 Tax=Filobasidium floriforme TaxID=5210 RepID=A0A8K0NP92_9TREE|nr:hypothetical protein FFLO_05101 [Filobasidium floriforme]
MSDDQDYNLSQSPHVDDGHVSPSQTDGYPQAEAVEEKIIPNINIVKPIGTTSKPARVSKRRNSTVKRKEQNRIAQRAFRIRKKVYHLELETNAIEAADKIRDMADSNSRLMKMVEKLQRENKALKATQAKANLSSETTHTQEKVEGKAKTVKRKERTVQSKLGGQRSSDAMLTIDNVELNVADDPLVSLNDLQAGLNDFEDNNKNDYSDIHPVEPSSVPSPGNYETRWTDPIPPPSMTMPSWFQEQQMYPPSTTRPSTSSSSYTPQTRSSLSSPLAYIGSLPALSSGRSGCSRPDTANAMEQHIEVINSPTLIFPSDSSTTPRYTPFGSQGQQAAAEFPSRCRYSSEVAAPSFPDTTAMYRDQQQQSAIRADSVRRYSRALQQHHHPRLHSIGDDGGVRAELQLGQRGDVGKQVDFSSQGEPSTYGGLHGVRDVWTGSLQPPVQGSTYVMPQSPNDGPNSQPRGPPS